MTDINFEVRFDNAPETDKRKIHASNELEREFRKLFLKRTSEFDPIGAEDVLLNAIGMMIQSSIIAARMTDLECTGGYNLTDAIIGIILTHIEGATQRDLKT